MNNLILNVTKITVLIQGGTDKITLYFNAPSPFPEMKYPANAVIEARQGYGVESFWVASPTRSSTPKN